MRLRNSASEGLRKRAEESIAMAGYVIGKLQAMGIDAWRNPSAITVVFPEPPEALRVKWQIATENGWSHIVCMPGVSKETIDEWLADMIRSAGIARK